jgi:hypothetical protein
VYVRLIVTVLARISLFVLAGCLFWSSVPVLWGWKSTTIMSDSMAPTVRAGDIVVAMPVENPASLTGRVLLFDDPDHPGRLRLHRLVTETPSGQLITRGDANGADDSTPIDPEAVHGVAVLRAPGLGLPFVWARDGRWELILATVVVVLAVGALAFRPSAAHRATPSGGARVIPATLSVIAAVTVVTVVGTTGGIAHAAYSTQSPNAINSLAAATAYTCLTDPPLDSPYVRYALNEGSGTIALDTSGNNRNGTLQSGVARVAGTCTGENPYVTLGDTVTSSITVPGAVTPPDEFSIEIWFTTTSNQGGQLIGFGSSATGTSAVADRRIWMRPNGALRFSIRQNNQVRTLNAGGNYRDGDWHHVVATLSSDGMRLYIDGVLEASNNRKVAYHYDPYGSVGYWRVGGDNPTGMAGVNTPTLASSIDNPAIYSTALTATQVAAHYAAGR